MKHPVDENDPKGLIRESYRIEGITEAECRSIFLDWAIGVPVGVEAREMVTALLERYGAANPDHPMTEVLKGGLGTADRPMRRGGARGRRS